MPTLNSMRKVCVVTTSRSDFTRIQSVIDAIRVRSDLELVLIVGGSHLLYDAGETVKNIEALGYPIDARAYTIVEGADLPTMAKSIGLGCMEFSTLFHNIRPDIVVVHGDRFDILPAALSAAMQNIHVAHIQGGEVSGTIDESIRHCITKMAHLHFVSTERAAERVVKLGEKPETIFTVGCPSVDILKSIEYQKREEVVNWLDQRYGTAFNASEPYLLVVQHPVTTEFAQSAAQMEELVAAVLKVGMQTILVYPNIDPGSKAMASCLRRMSAVHSFSRFVMLKDLPTDKFLNVLKYAACVAGNSSAGIREACYFGTPVVNVGTRQQGRDRGQNVIDAQYDRDDIFRAIQAQLKHSLYEPEEVYGTGGSGQKIADILATIALPAIQKRIAY